MRRNLMVLASDELCMLVYIVSMFVSAILFVCKSDSNE